MFEDFDDDEAGVDVDLRRWVAIAYVVFLAIFCIGVYHLVHSGS